MNPYGVSGNIFESTSNQSANSFQDPMNMSHLYPGWGVNPNYQTPAHDAPYRPAYRGPNPYAAYQKPTFMGGISQLYNPFYQSPYWGNPVDNNRQAFNSIASKPIDTAAVIGQSFIAPAVAYGVTQAMFRGTGAGLGRGLATGLGMGSMGAGAAGFAGSFMVPFAIGTGVMHAVEKGIFQPYIRSRQMSEMVSDSFGGITFGSAGNSISGRGLSGGQSSRIGAGIDQMGMRDLTFSANQFGGIAAMGMRAGLFDDVGSGDILKRVGSIASQIKSIIAISKDPNIQSAIEELAKLRLGGANISGGAGSAAMSAFGAIGMHSSAAGVSVQRMMNTVGNQGQYMFQMNGLTPYLGQVAAASAYSGFASAQRTGLLSTAQLARMGGVEGATQSAVAAQLSGSSTMFNRMGLMNQFGGAGKTSGVVPTVSAFGQMASRDPLSMMGNMGLYGNAMISQQLSGPDGIKNLENQAVQMLEAMGRRAGPNGLHDPGAVYAVLQGMGVPAEQLQSYFSLRASQTNPDIVAQSTRAFQAQGKEHMMQIIDQNMLWGGFFGRNVASAVTAVKGAYASTAEKLAYPVSNAVGNLKDLAMKGWYDIQYGSTMGDSMSGDASLDTNAIFNGVMERAGATKGKNGIFGVSSKLSAMNSTEFKILMAIQNAARSGGPGSEVAQKLINVGIDSAEGKKLFAKFMSQQEDSSLIEAFNSMNSSDAVYNSVASAAKGHTIKPTEVDKSATTVMDQAVDMHLAGEGALASNIEDLLKSGKFGELGKTLSGMDRGSQIAKIRELAYKKLRSKNINIRDDATATQLNEALASMRTYERASKGVMEASTSGVDYKMYNDASKSIDEGGKAILQAAHIIAAAHGKNIDGTKVGFIQSLTNVRDAFNGNLKPGGRPN